MAKKTLAPGFQRFEFRHGLTAKAPRGMNRLLDPGATPTDQFYLLQNCRIKGNEIVERGGQSKLIDSPLNGAVVGIWDAGIADFRPKMYVKGVNVNTYNPSQSPNVQSLTPILVAGVDINGTDGPVGLFNNDDVIFIKAGVTDSTFYLGKHYSTDDSTNSTSLTLLFTATGIANMTATAPAFQLGSNVYFQWNNQDTVTLRVYRWDATTGTVALDDTDPSATAGSLTYRHRLASLNNEVYYVGFPTAGGVSSVRKRAVAGTWSTVGTITGNTNDRQGNLIAFPVTGKLYCGGSNSSGEVKIYEITSSSIATARTISPGVGDATVNSLVIFNGYLYVLYSTNVVGIDEFRLARWDGTTWTDNHASVMDGITPAGAQHAQMFQFGDDLWIQTISGVAFKSNGTDTSTDEWTQMVASTWSNQAPIVVT